MSGIIHKTNAEDYLRSARIITGELAREAEQVTNYLSREQWLAEANAQAQIAQAEATLYLAEQQRIANLIAIASMESGVEGGIYTLCDPPNSEWSRYRLKPEIREGLGIS